MMKHPFRKEEGIFNHRFTLITEMNEFRMSLWVNGFGIIDNANGEMILAFMGAFDLGKHEENGDVLSIDFRIFPNGPMKYEVEINPFTRTFIYNGQTHPLANFLETFTLSDEK